jgi:hypothetical protein
LQLEKCKYRNHLSDLGINIRITLKRVLEKQGVKMWAKFNSFEKESNGGFCEHGDESSASTETDFRISGSNINIP